MATSLAIALASATLYFFAQQQSDGTVTPTPVSSLSYDERKRRRDQNATAAEGRSKMKALVEEIGDDRKEQQQIALADTTAVDDCSLASSEDKTRTSSQPTPKDMRYRERTKMAIEKIMAKKKKQEEEEEGEDTTADHSLASEDKARPGSQTIPTKDLSYRDRTKMAIEKIMAKKKKQEDEEEDLFSAGYGREVTVSDRQPIKVYLLLESSPSTSSSPTLELSIPVSLKAKGLFFRVSHATGIPLNEVKLFYRGREISEGSKGCVATEFGIENERTIRVVKTRLLINAPSDWN